MPRPKLKTQPADYVRGLFTRMDLIMNLSLPCWKCRKSPKSFWWKPTNSRTEVYCLDCLDDDGRGVNTP